MIELYFFILGLVNSIMLISVFIIRRKRIDLLQRFGWIYLLLSVPAAYGIFLAIQERAPRQYSIFLGIFLVYMFMEWILDHFLKLDFRESWKKNWMWLVPYLALYYAVNYGFIIMPWKRTMIWGIIMLILFVFQLITNIESHPKPK